MQVWSRFIIGVFFLFVTGELVAQLSRDSNNPLRGSQRNPNFAAQVDSVEYDTTIYNHFSMYDVNRKIPFSDTTLNDFHIYDPVRQGNIFGANLGNLGSSARHLFYEVPYQRGVNFGYDNYNYYRIKREDVRWYDVNRPFSDFYFSPIDGQQNFIVKAKFSRSFADSISFNLDYQRISQEGFYNNQVAKSTYLATGVRILRDKTDTYILGILNANNEVHNGGITSDSSFLQPFANFRNNIPVFLSDANTRNNNLELSVNNYYHLKDSLTGDIDLSLRHEFAIENGAFKFYDPSALEVFTYAPFAIDNRGVRNRIGYFHLENGFYVKMTRKAFSFHGGIAHDFYNIDQEPRKYKRNNLFLKGDGYLKILKGTQIDIKGHLGLADNAGDLWLEGSADIDLKLIGTIRGGIKLYRYEPTLIQQQVFFNSTEFWNNSFPKLNGTGFYLKYRNEKLGFTALGSVDAIDNVIFYNESKFPELQDGVFTSSRLILTERFSLGPVHFSNSVGLQGFNDNIYNLPSWLSEHNIYLEGKIFKQRMLARLGVDLRLVESYSPSAFAPELGVFYAQNNVQLDLFKMLDAYLSFKIDSFRFFARVENLNHILFDEINYLTPGYPQFDFKFRFGAAWQIKD